MAWFFNAERSEHMAVPCRLGNFRGVRRLLPVISLLLPGMALAADNGFYLGAARADVSPDYDLDFSTADHGPADEGLGFKLIGGIRPLDWLAVEANYTDLGETEFPLLVACPAIVGYPCPDRVSNTSGSSFPGTLRI